MAARARGAACGPGVQGTSDVLDGIDYLVWAVFAIEYLIKLYLSPSRWQFFRRHLVDLMIAVPVLRPLRRCGCCGCCALRSRSAGPG